MDTSFLLALLGQHRDPKEEIKATIPGTLSILVLDLVVLELERIARQGRSITSALANATLETVAKRRYRIVEHKPGPSDVDASLLTFAFTEKIPTAIATVDRWLRNALATYDLPSISPKSRHGLIVERLRF